MSVIALLCIMLIVLPCAFKMQVFQRNDWFLDKIHSSRSLHKLALLALKRLFLAMSTYHDKFLKLLNILNLFTHLILILPVWCDRQICQFIRAINNLVNKRDKSIFNTFAQRIWRTTCDHLWRQQLSDLDRLISLDRFLRVHATKLNAVFWFIYMA